MEKSKYISPNRLLMAIKMAAIPFSGGLISEAISAQELAQESHRQQMLETIEVTATRRSGSVQDVPINISAVSEDLMEQQGVEKIEDIARWVPGLTITDQGGRDNAPIIVRGLNTNSSGTSSDGETVATYLGEIPILTNMRILDVERVEVLIGPQGTLYGAGTLGGAIRYIPKKVDLYEYSGEISGNLYDLAESSGQGKEVGAVFNAPIIEDKLGVRFAVNYLDDPGYVDYDYLVREPGVSLPDPDWDDEDAVRENLYSVEDGNDLQQTSAKLQVRWTPSERFDSTLSYFYQKDEAGSRGFVHYNSLGADNPLDDQVGEYDSASRYLEPMTRENELFSLEMSADLGFAELVSATGFSKIDRDYSNDVTDLLIRLNFGYEEFPAFSGYTDIENEEKNLTQEIRLVSSNDGPISWIVGGYYSKNEYDRTYTELTEGFDEFAIDVWGAGGSLRPDSVEYTSINADEIEESALFGELTYEITDRLNVTLGARKYSYEVTTESAVDLPLYYTVFEGRDPDSILFDPQLAEGDDDGTLYKFNVSYNFTESLMGYATISDGFRIGGVNTVAACPDNIDQISTQVICALPNEQVYAADKTNNYELGLKSSWLDEKLTLNMAIFNIDWEDPQVDGITENGSVGITANAEGANAKGFELSSRILLTENLTLYSTYSYAKTEMTDDAFGIFGSDGDTVYDGDRLPGAPEHQFSLGVNYYTNLGSKDLEFNYGLTAQSDVYSTLGLKNYGEVLPGYSLSNLSAKLSDGAWDATFYIDNLFNKYAFISSVQNWGDIDFGNRGDLQRSHSHFVLTPRTMGLKFSYRFGN